MRCVHVLLLVDRGVEAAYSVSYINYIPTGAGANLQARPPLYAVKCYCEPYLCQVKLIVCDKVCDK